jgi:hypothetical protein
MNHTLHVQITGLGRTTANLETLTADADAALWREAAVLLRERVYATATGAVGVRADWSAFAGSEDKETVALEVEVVDKRETHDPRDAGSFVQLYFHDAFLLLNLAVPGSFGGVIAMLADGRPELALSAGLFEYAWATATRNGRPSIGPLPLADVVRWYDALQIGTQQLATTDAAKALFLLLHLSRTEENESASVIRLGQALEALLEESDKRAEGLPRFFELRDAIVEGTAPVLHPMADDALDDRVDDASIELVNAADFASSIVINALQEQVRRQKP